jgi:outer membrane protein assembly factor BamB
MDLQVRMFGIAAAGLVIALCGSVFGCKGRHATTAPVTVGVGSTGGVAGGVDLSKPAQFPTLSDAWKDAGYRLDWVGYPFVQNRTSGGLQRIVAYDDAVVVQDNKSVVSLLDARNGQLRWSLDLDAPLTKFVGITRDPTDPTRLIVSSESEAYALSFASGDMLRREKFARVVNTAPVAEGTTFVYGTAVGEVLAHRTGLGLKAWGFLGVGPIVADPVRVGDVVGTVSQAGDVTFLEPKTGSLTGRARIFGGLDSNPVGTSDGLYAAGLDQSVWCINPNGSTRWRYRTPYRISAQPAVDANVLYVEIPEQGMTALDAGTGEVKWKNAKVTGTPVARSGEKLLVHSAGEVIVVDRARGDVIARVPATGIQRVHAEKFADSTLYLVSDQNVVAKLSPR